VGQAAAEPRRVEDSSALLRMWKNLRRGVFLWRSCLAQAFQRGGSSSKGRHITCLPMYGKSKNELRRGAARHALGAAALAAGAAAAGLAAGLAFWAAALRRLIRRTRAARLTLTRSCCPMAKSYSVAPLPASSLTGGRAAAAVCRRTIFLAQACKAW